MTGRTLAARALPLLCAASPGLHGCADALPAELDPGRSADLPSATAPLAFADLDPSAAGSSPTAEPEATTVSRRRHVGTYVGRRLFVEPDSNAARQADLWRTSAPDDAAVMDHLATLPVALWLGDWDPDVRSTVSAALDEAGDELRTFVVYDIPHRDCGAWSSGGARDAATYRSFVGEVAAGLGGRLAIVVLEPDALALTTCLDAAGVTERHQLLSDAVDTLTASGAAVYLDAGDSDWIPAASMASALLDAGVQRAAGFALDVSHTEATADEIAYAEDLRAVVGRGAHYVIDTGRNGNGPDATHEWCNPLGRANGDEPTLRTGVPGLDALLWIKPPGESDGSCNGGPVAGQWWPQYALDLGVAAGY